MRADERTISVRIYGRRAKTRRTRSTAERDLPQSPERGEYLGRGVRAVSKEVARQRYDDDGRLPGPVQQQRRGTVLRSHRHPICLLPAAPRRHVKKRDQHSRSVTIKQLTAGDSRHVVQREEQRPAPPLEKRHRGGSKSRVSLIPRERRHQDATAQLRRLRSVVPLDRCLRH